MVRKWALALRVAPIIGGVVAAKIAFHFFGWEFLSVNPLFSGIVAGNVFLLGFLLSGVLSDYKESEKLPGDLAASIDSICDEVRILRKTKNGPAVNESFAYLQCLATGIRDWFHKREKTTVVLDLVTGLNDRFIALEPLTQANFIARLKQEQNGLRRILTRIHTIRETSFISSGYLVAEATTCFVLLGLVLAKIDPYYESLFFVVVISFLLSFMLALIRDLDNPFGYFEGQGSSEDVSLKPLEDVIARLERERNSTPPNPPKEIA